MENLMAGKVGRSQIGDLPDPAPEVSTVAVRELIEQDAGGDPGPLAVRPLGGGASRQVFLIETMSGVDTRRWVLRRTPPGADSFVPLEAEFAVVLQVSAAGVSVPRPIVFEPEGGRLDTAAYVMQFIEGQTIPQRILRSKGLASARLALPAQMGETLARLHSIPFAGLSGLPRPDQPDPALAACELWEGHLLRIGEAFPALELGLRWLRLNAPPAPPRRTLVHGDFRLGNLIVGSDGLRAVLDWELCHIGDPCEDLTWLAIRSWRYGNDDLEVAGLTHFDRLLATYRDAGGSSFTPERIHWWTVMSNLKWAVICAIHAHDHRTGKRSGQELAALGRRAAEPEWDMLEGIINGTPYAAAGLNLDPIDAEEE